MKLKETYALIVFLLLFPLLTVSTVIAQPYACNGDRTIASQSDLDALVQEDCYAIYGTLTISAPSLTNVDGLESLTGTSSGITITNNTLLTNLNGLQNVVFIGWDLIITENDVLASIAGLDNLIRITGDLIEIIWNPALDDLTPLYGTDVEGNYLVIQNNQILSMADAFQLLIQLSPPNGIFNGSSLITDNGLTDSDNDGIWDIDDNCINNCNTQQLDADGEGDVCDDTPGCSGCGTSCEIEC